MRLAEHGRVAVRRTGVSRRAGAAVNPATGVVRNPAASRPAAGAPVALRGVGCKPAVDHLRVQSDAAQNLRINVDTGRTIVDADLGFLDPDVDPGVDALVHDAAYRTRDDDPQNVTELYEIYAARDVLVEFPAVSEGPDVSRMLTVGALGVGTDAALVFHIPDTLHGTAYGLLCESASGKSTRYAIDLETGRATRVGLLAQPKS